MNRVEVQRHVEQMLAAESSCSPEDVLSGEVTVATLRPERFKSPHHRRFQYLEPTLSITTMGTGGIVAASPEWVGWVSELFEGLNRDEIFSWPLLTRVAQKIGDRELYGPIPHFVCSSETARQPATQTGYEIYLFGEGEMPELDPANWPHAVSSQPDPQRPDMLAAVAYDDERIVGVASASADSDMMWQIGIDVAEPHHGKGLGTALTAAVARAALEAGRVPYYATGQANIPSIRNALSAGFWQCWVQVGCSWN